MRVARKLMLLALAAIAAIAIAVSSASATNPIEVVNEKTATACSDIVSPHTSGGCAIHVQGTIKREMFIFTWITERACDTELELRIGADGSMALDDLDSYATEASANPECATNPPVVACDLPWEGSGEEAVVGNVHVTQAMCYDQAESEVCGGPVEYDLTEQSEAYVLHFTNLTVGSFCRLQGTLQTESSITGNAAIHINHL